MTAPTPTAAATTRSSARCFSTTALTGARATSSRSPDAASRPSAARRRYAGVPRTPWPRVPAASSTAGSDETRRGSSSLRSWRWEASSWLVAAPRAQIPGVPARCLWGIWLILTWSFISSSRSLNGYYLAALAPAMAALCGLGFALAWKRRAHTNVVIVVMTTVAVGVGYAVSLVPHSAGVGPWAVATSVLAAAGAVGIARTRSAARCATVGTRRRARVGRAGAAPRRGVGVGDGRG